MGCYRRVESCSILALAFLRLSLLRSIFCLRIRFYPSRPNWNCDSSYRLFFLFPVVAAYLSFLSGGLSVITISTMVTGLWSDSGLFECVFSSPHYKSVQLIPSVAVVKPSSPFPKVRERVYPFRALHTNRGGLLLLRLLAWLDHTFHLFQCEHYELLIPWSWGFGLLHFLGSVYILYYIYIIYSYNL